MVSGVVSPVGGWVKGLGWGTGLGVSVFHGSHFCKEKSAKLRVRVSGWVPLNCYKLRAGFRYVYSASADMGGTAGSVADASKSIP